MLSDVRLLFPIHGVIFWPSSCFRTHRGQHWDQGEEEIWGFIRGKSYRAGSWKKVWSMNPKFIGNIGCDLYWLMRFWRWTLGFKMMHIPWVKQMVMCKTGVVMLQKLGANLHSGLCICYTYTPTYLHACQVLICHISVRQWGTLCDQLLYSLGMPEHEKICRIAHDACYAMHFGSQLL